jgi:hypothetical protein
LTSLGRLVPVNIKSAINPEKIAVLSILMPILEISTFSDLSRIFLPYKYNISGKNQQGFLNSSHAVGRTAEGIKKEYALSKGVLFDIDNQNNSELNFQCKRMRTG